MKVFFNLVLYFQIGTTGFGQQTVGGVEGKGMDFNAIPHGVIKEIRGKAPLTIGDHFLYKDWFEAEIFLYNGQKIEGYQIRYDIDKDLIEIKDDSLVKVLFGIHIKKFVLHTLPKNEVLINGSEYSLDGVPLVGFLKVLVEGDWSLVSRIETELVENDYSPTLDFGNKDNKIVQKESYYFSRHQNLNKVTNKKGVLKQIFASEYPQVETLKKTEKLNFNKKEDLIVLVELLNQQK